MFNFQKREMIYKVIQKIKYYKKKPFSFSPQVMIVGVLEREREREREREESE